MKRITLVLVTLALAAGMAVAEDVIISVSGSASVEWGFGGQLIANNESFLDESVASSDFFSDGGDLDWDGYPTLMLTATVEDADGNIIVEAASEDYDLDIGFDPPTGYGADMYPTVAQFDRADIDDPEEITDLALDYINFPNVIPGVLGIKLMGDNDLDPAYSPADSTSKNERILINVTPIEQLDATLGLLIKPDNKLYTRFYNGGVVAGTGTFVWPDDGDPADGGADADDFDDTGADTLDANPWEAGTFLSFAASLEATFTQAIGKDGELSVGFGTVYDTAFFNDSYEPDFKDDGLETYSVLHPDAPNQNEAGTQFLITEEYGPIAVNPLSMEDEDHASFGGDAADDTELRTNEVRGRTTIPFGLGITADIAGLSAAVDFELVLAEGKDESNMTGIVDFTDPTKSTYDYADYVTPMYFAVDLGYELGMGDMTITPGLNFKYCSDFWKWDWDSDQDDWEWSYEGDVSPADFLGRPMSVAVGVDVGGIAGMIDVGISAGLSLGDGVSGSHGLGNLPPYIITGDDTGATETYVYDNTLAELMDFWANQSVAADDVGDYPLEAALLAGADYVPDTASDGQNNNWFASGNSAMDIEVDISAEVIDGLTIGNVFTYTIDNVGIGGADDDILFGEQLSSIEDELTVEYAWMVGDAVAFTIFGGLTFESVSYETEKGQKVLTFRSDTADSAPDVLEFNYSEAPSMNTFDYEVGVKVSVGL
jgi:hypothetical protein